MMLLNVLFLSLVLQWQGSLASTMLYDGLQTSIISPNLTTQCDAAFNTSLDCPQGVIQWTTWPMQSVLWNTSTLQSLCTSSCEASLSDLASATESACADDIFTVDGNNITLGHLTSLIDYKFGLICLQDETTQDFCVDVENSWNITNMVNTGSATWPNQTTKCYYDSSQGYWDIYTDADGNCTSPYDFYLNRATDLIVPPGTMAGWDYFYNRSGAINDDNYGWPEPLEFDEYLLEIQCSSCFLQKFKYGLTSSWGDVWDDLTEQVWNNMKLNCGFDDDITPANNMSGQIPVGELLPDPPPITTDCPQNITISGNQSYTCAEALVEFRIPTAGLRNLNNDISCSGKSLNNRTLCAPMSCPIQIVNLNSTEYATDTETIQIFVASYTNFTVAQFYQWNQYIGFDYVRQGDVICAGPPIQIYLPSG